MVSFEWDQNIVDSIYCIFDGIKTGLLTYKDHKIDSGIIQRINSLGQILYKR